MGWPEVARKLKNLTTNRSSRRRLLQPDPARPTSVGREISRPASSGGSAPPCPVRVAVWWPVMPPFVQSPTARNGQNDPTRVHKFGEPL